MLYFAPWKKALVIILCLLGIMFAAPNVWYEQADEAGLAREQIDKLEKVGLPVDPTLVEQAAMWPDFLPASVVNLGLDLRGGAHLLVEVNVEEVQAERMISLVSEARTALREGGVRKYTRLKATTDTVSVRITDPADVPEATRILRGLAQPVVNAAFGTQSADLTVTDSGDQTLVITMTEDAIVALTDRTMAQSLEIVRRRIDEAGTREPTIQRQGCLLYTSPSPRD